MIFNLIFLIQYDSLWFTTCFLVSMYFQCIRVCGCGVSGRSFCKERLRVDRVSTPKTRATVRRVHVSTTRRWWDVVRWRQLFPCCCAMMRCAMCDVILIDSDRYIDVFFGFLDSKSRAFCKGWLQWFYCFLLFSSFLNLFRVFVFLRIQVLSRCFPGLSRSDLHSSMVQMNTGRG